MASDDADIDALMGAVLGNDGTPAAFPERPARPAQARPARRSRSRTVTTEPVDLAILTPPANEQAAAPGTSLAGLTGELAAILTRSTEADDKAKAARKIIDPRDVRVRFTFLKHMALSPLHYWDAVQADRDDTMAMRLGRGAHAMVLGEPVVLYPGKTRQGKKWDLFQKQHAGAEILIGSEWDKSVGIARAIERHPDAAQLLYDGTILEQTIEWEFMGRACSSRPDSRCVTGRAITDLKTTQCAEPEKFKRDAMWRGYNAQLAFYDQAVEWLTGRQADDLFVVAIESKRPHAITILKLTDEAREQGRRLCRLWFERLKVCEESNAWPAYVDHVVELGVPEGSGELTLTIGGEAFGFDDAA